MALNNWMAKHSAIASRMGPMDVAGYSFSFIDVDSIEQRMITGICNHCKGNCTGATPLDPFCRHHVQALKFAQCAIAGDLSLANWPELREEDDA